MAEVVLLDESKDFPVSSQGLVMLTQEQKERIAKQKELALARRSANERYKRSQLFSSSHIVEAGRQEGIVSDVEFGAGSSTDDPEVLQVQQRGLLEDGDGKPNVTARTAVSNSDNGRQGYQQTALGKRGKQMEIIDVEEKSVDEYLSNPCKSQQREFTDVKVATTLHGAMEVREKTRYVIECDDTILGEWRSVRKRPVPGHSFRPGVNSISHGISPSMRVQQVILLHDAIENESQANQKDPLRAEIKLNEQKSAASGSHEVEKNSDKISLSSHQMKVLKAIRQGKSVFITGSAGTGKSFLLEFAVRVLKRVYGPESVFVTASTGLAACALGGTTLHSFAGIGLGLGSKVALADKVRTKRDVRKRWMNAKALIIDEISMIDGELFDKLEYVASAVRKPSGHSQVFGGLQLIVTGDFFQLPPVSPENPQKYFAFDADCWNRCFDLQIEFKRVFRQSDSEFVALLNELRKGYCSPTTRERLLHCLRPVDDPDTGIMLTRLYPRKVDVGRENEQNLNALNKGTFPFLAKDVGQSEFAMRQLDNVRAEKVLHLCVGAQVMLVKNLETSVGLVNGARGVIVRFIPVDDSSTPDLKSLASAVSPSGVLPVVRFACDKVERVVGPESWSVVEGNREIAKRSQIPLILAWALSVHKCQGMTLDRVETDLSRAFDYGMVYVALSRVKSLDGLRLIGFDPSRIKVHPKVVQFYEGLKSDE